MQDVYLVVKFEYVRGVVKCQTSRT